MSTNNGRFMCTKCLHPVLEWVQLADATLCCSCAAVLIAELRANVFELQKQVSAERSKTRAAYDQAYDNEVKAGFPRGGLDR